MSKKKNNGKDNLIDLLSDFQDLLSGMDEDELLLFDNLLSNNPKTEEMIDSNWYDYQRPNYAKMSKPLAGWLLPMAKVISFRDIPQIGDEAIAKATTMDPTVVESDLRNYIYAFLADANNDASGTFEHNDNLIPLIPAFRVMAKCQLTGLLDAALETLKQNYKLSNQLYLSGGAFIGTSIIYELGKNQMPKIVEFLNSQGFIPMVKPIAFNALVSVYFLEPRLKLTALHHITTYLQNCYEIGTNGGLMTNVDHYASTLAKANVREALPIMKKIYADCDIPHIEVDGYNDLVHLMNDKQFTLKDELLTMEQIAENQKEYANNSDDLDEFDIFDNFDNIDDFDESDDFYDTPEPILAEDQQQKCMTIRMTLNGTNTTVERTINVPSNIYLPFLKTLLEMLADWWDEFTEYKYEYEKDGELYLDYTDLRLDGQNRNIHIADEYTLQDLVSAPGDTLTFRIWQGKGMHWENTITVVENRKYKKSEKRLLKLVSITGPYPTSKMRSMKSFDTKAAKGQLSIPNIEILKADLQDFEDENT